MTKTEHATVRSFIASLPKTEIHLHIEGLVSVDTIWALIRKHNLDFGIRSKEALRKKFEVRSLDEFIDLFINIVQACFLNEDDLDYLIEDARSYLGRNNIRRAEIFFAPTKLIKNGLSFASLVDKLDAGARSLAEDGLEVRYIVDVSRGFGLENAMRNFHLTLDHMTDHIVGLGLGGAEQTGPAQEYKPVFDEAVKHGLKLVAHAGEDMGPESVWDTVRLLNVARIGHGIAAIRDRALMDHLRDTQIPLEICPTSNLFTRKFATTLEEHPIRPFYDHGMYVTVNTDDPTLFGVELTDEYLKLIEHGIFTVGETIDLIRKGIGATFASSARKQALLSELETTVAASEFADRLSAQSDGSGGALL
ncbi:MAG: adenosine deaminase [Spirochaetaceae bacterium]